MKHTEESQITMVQAIFSGAIPDKDGYCGCPKCGHKELIHDGIAIDDGYISCILCHFTVNGSDPYEMIHLWNNIDRTCFQLQIIFP